MPRSTTKLTFKESEFVKRTAASLNPTQAAREVYDTKNPSVMAYNMMQKPKIQDAIEIELDKAGIPRHVILERLGNIIKSPQSKLDGISVSAANLVGKWAGWEAGSKKLDMPEIPKTAEEIDIMLIRMRSNVEEK